jgi:DNA-binding IclR family transcriptional regulator
VPVRDPASKRVLAALAVHAPTARATLEELLESVDLVKQTASRLAPLLQAPPQG